MEFQSKRYDDEQELTPEDLAEIEALQRLEKVLLDGRKIIIDRERQKEVK